MKFLLVIWFTLFSTFCFAQEDEVYIQQRNYRDYLAQLTDFGVSFSRYQTRGYGYRHEQYRVNGLDFRDLETDMPMWVSLVGYVNNRKEYNLFRGLDFEVATSFLGGISGAEYISVKEPLQRTMQVSGSVSNRTYSYRLGGFYANSWKNGLSSTIEASKRWGRSFEYDGVWNDAWSLAVNVNKIINPKNVLDFNLIFTPNSRARLRYSTEEAFELTSKKYNPNWGYQNGKQRSARVGQNIVPIATISHTYDINDKTKLVSTLGVAAGVNSYSGINWRDAPNPNPDYYRYMPSYQTDPVEKEYVTQLWKDDTNVSQINYDKVYQVNQTQRAHYIDEKKMKNIVQIQGQSVLRSIEKDYAYSVGVDFAYASELRYKKVEDLFGAQYWLDVDHFLESDDDFRELTQNNTRNPNRRVKKGDTFGYNYLIQRATFGAFGMVHKNVKRWHFSGGLELKYHSLSRVGYYEKQNFPGNLSYGNSDLLSMFEFRVKGKVEYRIGSMLSTHIALSYINMPQQTRNYFLDPNYRNSFVENPVNENILSLEMGLKYITSKIRLGASVYATDMKNAIEVLHFYDGIKGFYCDYVLNGIEKSYIGGEFSFEAQLATNFWLNIAVAFSRNKYVKNPTADQYSQTTGQKVAQEEVFYQGLYVSGSPQSVMGIGFSYSNKGWMANINCNAVSSSYEQLSPFRYTQRAYNNAMDKDLIRKQESLTGSYSLDLFLGKSFEFLNYSRLGVYAGVNNITNYIFKTAAFQSNRLIKYNKNYSPMASKYYYGIGTNFFVTISYTF